MPDRRAMVTAVTGDHATLSQLMEATVRQIGDREAYVDVASGRRLSFAEWIAAADGVAAELGSMGVGPGDVVAVWLPSSIDFAIACAGAVRAGAVVTGINDRLGPREVAAILERGHPSVVVAPDDQAPPVECRRLTRTALSAAAEAGGPRADPGRSPEDPAVIIWTSGTTGTPRGAWFDHRNLAAAVRTAGAMSAPFDRRIFGMPMAHAGYLSKLWEQLALGMTLVLPPPPWTAEGMLEVLVEEQITVGAGVPTQWSKLLEVPALAAADLEALRLCLVATAPAAPELIERMRRDLRAEVIVRYAMTESPSITGTVPTDPPEVQHRTVGRAQEGVTVDVVDDRGAPLPDGEVGRVRVAGPCVLRGYWNDPEATASVLDEEGRLLSTDLGYLEAGNLVLVGRASELYIRGGYNVYPLEVEHVLAEHPAVAAAAVVGAARDVIGEIGVAFVVPAPGRPAPSLDELRAWVAGRLADYKAPDELRLLGALPLTAMGKVDKRALASLV
jgi:acyl-CoA synthetase (AMP-forming)/AMP-acid ligase II